MKVTEQYLIEKLIGSYNSLGSVSPSSWVVFSDDLSEFEFRLRRVCHMEMHYHRPNTFDQLFTAVPKKDKLSISYLEWLIAGPFRLFEDRISLEKFKDNYFIRCRKLDTWPANVLMNFCIATRIPIEKPNYLDRWKIMCEAGVDKMLAFIVATRDDVYAPKGTDPWGWFMKNLHIGTNHFWFDAACNWRGLINGEMNVVSFSKNFKEQPRGSTPCNVIWGKMVPDLGHKLAGKTTKELSEIFIEDKAPQGTTYYTPYVGTAPDEMDDFDDDDNFDDDEFMDDFDDDDNFDDDEFFENLDDEIDEEIPL